ncbi:alpha/beta hydrolase domain-containing protein [Holotrichia oblita]|uniref:Alpha/beta hydrolase domain-containing protein n=1 Tax=Holotrichia oblita TaxID=644536 RepID=A0ACB9TI14_HOLOL|nr:alpha/beta hydrolase domain-containing protein [Holotrichia oblita]
MIMCYGEARSNSYEAQRIYRERYPLRQVPNVRTFIDVRRRLREDGCFRKPKLNSWVSRTRRTVRNEETVLRMQDSFEISVRTTGTELLPDKRHGKQVLPVLPGIGGMAIHRRRQVLHRSDLHENETRQQNRLLLHEMLRHRRLHDTILARQRRRYGPHEQLLLRPRKWLNCNVFGYDYSGYGASEGRPTEKDLYADIEAAFAVLTTKYKVKPVHVILYGQSIGTVPTVDLATRQQVGAVILHSALMSGMRVLCPSTSRTWFFDAFPVIDKIEKVTAPTLVIHGKNDNVIDISHGLRIYERCPRAVEPLWVEGHGHDDVDCRCGAYLERLRLFINVELGDQ